MTQSVHESSRDVPLVVVLEDATNVGGAVVEEIYAQPPFVLGESPPVVLRRT
jgi:hypothetical protein